MDIGGNHLIKNIKALLWASSYFHGSEPASWRQLGEALLVDALDEQVTPDGAHFELSPAYHVQVFADMLECYSLLDDGELRDNLSTTLRLMAQFLTDMVHPDGQISLFSDGGLDMSYCPVECLAAFERLVGSTVSQSRNIEYPYAGYYGLRSGDDLILVDVAELAPPQLPAHGHGDALSFEWSVSGQRVIIDPGVFEYNEGPSRDFSRSTLNHNTVTLDDKEQSEFWKAFRVGRRAKIVNRSVEVGSTKIHIKASHDGYMRLRGEPLHQRQFELTEGRVRITDHVFGGHGQRAVARLMLAPGISINKVGSHYTLHGRGFYILLDCNADISVKDSECFLNFGERKLTKQIEIYFGEAPCSCEMSFTVHRNL